MSAPQQQPPNKQPKQKMAAAPRQQQAPQATSSGSKQRMAGDAFLNGGFYNKTDEAITNNVLSGQYKVDDSFEAQKSFVQQQQSMNQESQKKYEDGGLKTAEKYVGFRGGDVDMNALQGRVDSSIQSFWDKAKIQDTNTYGDRDAMFNYKPFEFGAAIEEVKSNASDIAEKYAKDLK